MASQPPQPPKPWETRRIPGAGPGPGPGPTFQSQNLGQYSYSLLLSLVVLISSGNCCLPTLMK
uniref:Peroxisomal biogenesis factor 13 n=1 Tax=Equus asinus TaxID=9793 RepID=A0A9L0J0D1_EQUAS